MSQSKGISGRLYMRHQSKFKVGIASNTHNPLSNGFWFWMWLCLKVTNELSSLKAKEFGHTFSGETELIGESNP